jgi:hypothetical protein
VYKENYGKADNRTVEFLHKLERRKRPREVNWREDSELASEDARHQESKNHQSLSSLRPNQSRRLRELSPTDVQPSLRSLISSRSPAPRHSMACVTSPHLVLRPPTFRHPEPRCRSRISSTMVIHQSHSPTQQRHPDEQRDRTRGRKRIGWDAAGRRRDGRHELARLGRNGGRRLGSQRVLVAS